MNRYRLTPSLLLGGTAIYDTAPRHWLDQRSAAHATRHTRANLRTTQRAARMAGPDWHVADVADLASERHARLAKLRRQRQAAMAARCYRAQMGSLDALYA